VIAAAYKFASGFSNALAAVSVYETSRGKRFGTTGFINRDGDFEIPPVFGETGRFRSGLCLVTTEDEIGYIPRTGEFVWKGPYTESRIGFDLST